jgi:23S rRNA (uridine2552-2'-O)-methyltransferase
MVGDRGKIVGVDLAPIEPPIQGARVIQGDLRDERVLQQAASELGGKAHVILSDLAPKLTGIRERDDARAAELAREVLRLLPRLLGEGGKLLLKLFVGPELSSLTGELRARFRDSQVTRPEATRKGSSEVYFVGMGYLGSESDHG